MYREYAINCNASVAIDATGSIVKKLKRSEKCFSKHIFLYQCVINSEAHEKLSVAHMISECQTINYICFWLMEFVKTGAPPPKEVTCDGSKALLTATIRAFTNCSSINEYADECWANVPGCYVRIDVAHFSKLYATYFSGINPRVKKFFMASLG